MSEKKTARLPMADHFVAKKRKETKLDKINKLINWTPINEYLGSVLHRTVNAAGKPAYPGIVMFKCLLLQRMYNLSDVEIEEQVRDRFSFLRFVGLGVTDDIPDATTVCRFRNELLGDKVCEKLFQMILSQLEEHGSFHSGVIVDATVVASARRPRKTMEVVVNDRKEPDITEAAASDDCKQSTAQQTSVEAKTKPSAEVSESVLESNEPSENSKPEQVTISYSDDTQAAWTVKQGKPHYGYKVHMASCPESGLVLGGHVTPANRSDMNELGQVLEQLPADRTGRCYADKGYTSKKNSEIVKAHKLRDGIMDKAVRGRGLNFWQKVRNKCISSVRSGIERIFGTFKRSLGFDRSRYVGQAKVEQEFYIVSMSYNIIRFSNICII